MVSKASEDLPDPESPVMTTRLSRGISTSTFLRLCSRAPRTEICCIREDIAKRAANRESSLAEIIRTSAAALVCPSPLAGEVGGGGGGGGVAGGVGGRGGD